eukprot:33296-Amphidinium_carterae.1
MLRCLPDEALDELRRVYTLMESSAKPLSRWQEVCLAHLPKTPGAKGFNCLGSSREEVVC